MMVTNSKQPDYNFKIYFRTSLVARICGRGWLIWVDSVPISVPDCTEAPERRGGVYPSPIITGKKRLRD